MADIKDADEPEEWTGAQGILEAAIGRIRTQRVGYEQNRFLLLEELRITELMLSEATIAENAIEGLLAGDLFAGGDEVRQRWGKYEEESNKQFEIEQVAPEPVVAVEEPPPMVEARPEPATAPSSPDTLPEAKTLTDKQQALFDALCRLADADWRVTASFGRLRTESGLSLGGISAHICALERKDMIQIFDYGNSKTPGNYIICHAARPHRDAAPKTDQELIEEAMAAGKVTVCPQRTALN